MQEIIFRGTDTTTLLTEWTMAKMVMNPIAQRKVQEEIEVVVGKSRSVRDSDICKLPYLQAVVKETLQMHPSGPLLSWAKLLQHFHFPLGSYLGGQTAATFPLGCTRAVSR
ncbi:hypothetical protein SUGI_0035500 [Cryptomeria japonica]|nr:hypothetical protein SUGI_0035500 [Cryptomeria japonica]